MANTQIDDGNYTRFANEILMELVKIKLSGQELQLILFVFRKTYGFVGKHKGDFISLSQIAEALNISQDRAARVLVSVVKKKIIVTKNDRKRTTNFVSFNKDFDMWTTVEKDSSIEGTTTVEKDSKLLSKKTGTTVEKDSKTTVEKDIYKRKKETLQKKLLKKLTKPSFVPPKKLDFIDEIIDVFKDEYLTNRGIEYRSNGVDRSAVGKLLSFYKKDGSNSEETLKDFRGFFQKCLDIEDKWFWDNMTLPIINSKINEIRIKIGGKNGTKRNSNSFTTAELRELSEEFANDPRYK